MLMIVDEVQTGNGRSGMLYSYMNYDVMPDIVSTAKGIGGGLPLGATMLGERVKDIFTPGSHGSTFGGNPVVRNRTTFSVSLSMPTVLKR